MRRRTSIRGSDGLVEVDEANQRVTKTYLHADRKVAAQNALREVTYASRFREAFLEFPGISCPRILSWELCHTPRIVMALCPGQRLSTYLRCEDAAARIAEIAGKIHDGLEIYTRFFDEPYYDLCFSNLLYDEASHTLTFLDFVIPGRHHGASDSPLEASLGSLVGCACYELARPRSLFSPKRGCLQLLEAVLASFKGQVSTDRVFASARAVFFQLCAPGGTVRRRYYKTIGVLVNDICLGQLMPCPAPALRPLSDSGDGSFGSR